MYLKYGLISFLLISGLIGVIIKFGIDVQRKTGNKLTSRFMVLVGLILLPIAFCVCFGEPRTAYFVDCKPIQNLSLINDIRHLDGVGSLFEGKYRIEKVDYDSDLKEEANGWIKNQRVDYNLYNTRKDAEDVFNSLRDSSSKDYGILAEKSNKDSKYFITNIVNIRSGPFELSVLSGYDSLIVFQKNNLVITISSGSSPENRGQKNDVIRQIAQKLSDR